MGLITIGRLKNITLIDHKGLSIIGRFLEVLFCGEIVFPCGGTLIPGYGINFLGDQFASLSI